MLTTLSWVGWKVYHILLEHVTFQLSCIFLVDWPSNDGMIANFGDRTIRLR